MDIKDLMDRVLSDNKLTMAEHQILLDAIDADGKVDDEEKAQITRLLELIENGTVEVV